jgi:hypothetical protein
MYKSKLLLQTLKYSCSYSAMTILSKGELNILDRITTKDYKRCLSRLESCILATDLGVFFKNKKATQELTSTGYDPTNPQHKDLYVGISMTCCDLSAMFKKWDDSRKTAEVV